MDNTTYQSLKHLNELSGKVINAAMEVHTYHGPGLLESMYTDSLVIELKQRGFEVDIEVLIPVSYKGISLDKYKKIDMVVDKKIIMEIKAVETVLPVHEQQVLTYLKISGLRLGLLLNFNTEHMRDGITRVIR
jgi:GxxExxY protein